MIFFTSANLNYADKVTVLAKSVKKNYPNDIFVWVAVEKKELVENQSVINVDHIISIEDFKIPQFQKWIFQFSVVEACTAIKADAFLHLVDRFKPEQIIYLDPNTRVYSKFFEVERALESKSVVLTPLLTKPNLDFENVLVNELVALKHGTFNLGFIAIAVSNESLSLIKWWRDQLRVLCFDEKDRGLFNDQIWMNLAIGFFDFIHILRDDNYNIATWNMSNRQITKVGDQFFANGLPIRFINFPGYDSGAHHGMLDKYAKNNPLFRFLSREYETSLQEVKKFAPLNADWSWAQFDNGEFIDTSVRRKYRDWFFPNLQNPFELDSNFFSQVNDIFKSNAGLLALARAGTLNKLDDFTFNSDFYIVKISDLLDNQKQTILLMTHGLRGGVNLAITRHINELIDEFNIIIISPVDKHIDKYNLKISIHLKDGVHDIIVPIAFARQLLNHEKIKIDFLHIHHALNMEDTVKDFCAELNTPQILFIHDYYFFNPFWEKIGSIDQLGSIPLTDFEYDTYLQNEKYSKRIKQWGNPSSWVDLLKKVDEIRVPSLAVKKMISHIDFLKNKIQFYPPLDFAIPEFEKNIILQKNSRLKICVMGEIGNHKGSRVIEHVMKLPESKNLEFVCLGKIDITSELFSEQISSYTPDIYFESLQYLNPDVIWLPNQVEETYSYTLTEALSYECVVVVSNIEVFKERCQDRKNVIIVDKNSPPETWLEHLQNSLTTVSERFN